MTTAQIIKTIIELFVVIAVIVGVFNEGAIADWEQKQFKKLKRKVAKLKKQ